ncbi:MAG TPA: ABC transporter ATP-binding protein [Anaeromyxobacter sp.]
MSAIALERITCSFATPRQGSYTAVEDVSLAVGETEFVSLIGPTGCGKSTLLNVMAGLHAPTAGQVTVFGRPQSGINRDAGYMFQADALMPWRTTLENVIAGLQFRGCEDREARRLGREWLERVGLSRFGDHHPHQLSGGMRKRAALAQMLVLNPRIILMDEPFSALDVQTRQLMENELLALWAADRRCAVFVTHDLEEAIALSDRVVVLSAGPATRVLAEFEIRLPRPRDVAEVRLTPAFVEVHHRIWAAMRDEVTKAYRRSQQMGNGGVNGA